MLKANLTSYQKSAYYAGIKLFSTLPTSIKRLKHIIEVFMPVLPDYLGNLHGVHEKLIVAWLVKEVPIFNET